MKIKGIPFLLFVVISTSFMTNMMYGKSDAFIVDAISNKRETVDQINDNIQFYERLSNELTYYENFVNKGLRDWFSARPAVIMSVIGSVLGSQKIIEFIEQQGFLNEATNDTERMFIKGYCGSFIGLALFALGFTASSSLLNQFIAKPLSEYKLIRKLYAFNPHIATKYLKRRLRQTKNKIVSLCRELPLDEVDKLRHKANSAVKEELLMKIAQELLGDRQAISV